MSGAYVGLRGEGHVASQPTADLAKTSGSVWQQVLGAGAGNVLTSAANPIGGDHIFNDPSVRTRFPSRRRKSENFCMMLAGL